MAVPIVYPNGLPGPRLSPYQPYELRKVTTQPGRPQRAPKEHGRRGTQQVEFIFDFEHLPTWSDWLETDLVRSGAWFSAPKWKIPFSTGAQHRFIGEPSHAEYFPGLGWRVTATCEVREGPTPQLYDMPEPPVVEWRVLLQPANINTMIYGDEYVARDPDVDDWQPSATSVWNDHGSQSSLGPNDVEGMREVIFDWRNSAVGQTGGEGSRQHQVAEFTITGVAFGIKLGISTEGGTDLETDISPGPSAAYYAWDGSHQSAISETESFPVVRGSWPPFETGDVIGFLAFIDARVIVFLNGVVVGELLISPGSGPYLFAVRSCPITGDPPA